MEGAAVAASDWHALSDIIRRDLYPYSMPSRLVLAPTQYACVRRFAAPPLVVVMLAL